MKRSFLTVIGAAIILVSLAVATAAPAETIKLATLAPKGSPWHEILKDMAAEWEAAGEGRFDVRIYPGGVLGDEPDLMRKMAIGQIDGAMITTVGLTLAVPDFWIFQMPMLFQSYAELDYVRDRLAPEFAAKLRKKGFVMLNWGEAGWVRFFSNRPVVTTDDLRRIKLFVWAGEPGPVAHWKKEGFQPVPLPVPELFTALQSGMVDAYATTSVASLSFQWFGLAPHMIDLKWGVLVGGTILRVKVWDKLPRGVQDKMRVAAKKAGVRFRERTRSFEIEAVRVMERNGLTVHKVPPAALAVWEAAARRSYGVVVGPYVSPQFAERAMRLRDEFRSTLAVQPASN